MTSYKPREDDLSQNYDLDFLNNLNDWDILSKVNNVTNKELNTPAINIANEEHHDYYD